jgi:hypothetical protein
VSQKLLIVLLVVLVVIFVITVGIGGCHASGSGKDPDHAGFVGALKGLQGKRWLVIGDKTTTDPLGCAPPKAGAGLPSPMRFTISAPCTVKFQKRAFFRTGTRVAFRTDGPLNVVVTPKNGPQLTKTVGASDCYGTAIDHAGGTMTLTPLLGARTITLQRQACPKP